MPLIARLLLLIAGLSWMFAVAPAQAVGFGRPPANVVLGAALDIGLPVRLDGDESADLECVSAEAQFGDRRVAPFNLRWAVEPGAAANERVIRVISLVVVDEPVVSVQVNVGCTTRVSRRFTAFADPPMGGVAAPAVAPATPSSDAALAGRADAASPAVVPAARAPLPVKRRVPTPPRRSTIASAKSGASGPAAARAPAAGPRLALEAPDPSVMQQAMAAALAEQQASAAQAAQAASAAAADAAAAALRVKALEEQVARLLADGKQQREQLQQLRAQTGRNDAAGRWLPWLGAALAISLALAAWLAWRLRRLQREAHSRWWADAAEVLADARPDPQDPTHKVSGLALPSAEAADAAARRVQADAALAELGLEAYEGAAAPEPAPTQPAETALNPVTVEPGWSATRPPPRAVSADELIDLEQQAEFFVVLGQDEAAIDLLVGHLRDSGGTSPLPYLKLLEIYRRRGDHEAYDRTRSRFNQRFNAYAPEWDTDMQQGRVLAEYPQVLMRLQRAWTTPIDAMTELQTLLFRTEGGELFELPAYRELLLLYSVARDLHDHFDQPGADVDLLLPLDASGFEPTAPVPAEMQVGEATMVLTPEVRLEGPTQFHTVDLDLGQEPARETLPARGRARR